MQNLPSKRILKQPPTLKVPPSGRAGRVIREHRARREPLVPALLLLSLVTVTAATVFAHTDSPGSLPLRPYSMRLQHRRPADIVALFSREQLPDSGERIPRAARIDTPESLLPGGTQAVLRTQTPDELVVVATEGSDEMENCIRELDVPVQRVGSDREKVVITLRRASATGVRAAVLRLPGAGSATANGRRLVLAGKPAWIHRALRSVIRAELRLPEPAALNSP